MSPSVIVPTSPLAKAAGAVMAMVGACASVGTRFTVTVTGALAGLKADILSGGLTLGGGLLAGGVLGALGAAGAVRGVNTLRGQDSARVSWDARVLDSLMASAVLGYLAVAHHGRGRGAWVAAEPPARWVVTVDAVLAAHRAEVQALWTRRAEGLTDDISPDTASDAAASPTVAAPAGTVVATLHVFQPFGAAADAPIAPAPAPQGNLFLAPFEALAFAARKPMFWILAGSFFVCGASTNGLVQMHLIPMCGDYEIAATAARTAPAPRRRPADISEEELLNALEQNRWDLKATAAALDIARPSLYMLLDKAPHIRTVRNLTAEELARSHRECGGDLDAMAAAITDRTRLIFVCNPNNPTGTVVGADDLRAEFGIVDPPPIRWWPSLLVGAKHWTVDVPMGLARRAARIVLKRGS